MITRQFVPGTDLAGERQRTVYQVLHVLDHSWPVLSGYSMRSRYLVAAQREVGMHPRVLTGPLHQLDDACEVDTVVDGVPYLRTPFRGSLSRLAITSRWPLVREAEVVRLLRDRIVELLRRQPADLIHAHSPALCGLAAWRASRITGTPFVYEIRAFWEDAAVDQNRVTPISLRYRLTRSLEGFVSRRAHAVVGISSYVLDDLRNRGIDSKKLFHVPNGVDVNHFAPLLRDDNLAAHLGLGKSPVLGFIGTMYRYEGISWLVRAAEELRKRGIAFQLLLVGAGEDLAGAQCAVREAHAEDYIRVLGPIPHEEIRRYYSLMDTMVYPRRRNRLTDLVTPLKPLEAMAQAKAVLGSDVGGIRELIRDGDTGVLFQEDSIEDFCRKAERLVRDHNWRRELGERARKSVLEEKDWRILVRRYESPYETAIRRTRRR